MITNLKATIIALDAALNEREALNQFEYVSDNVENDTDYLKQLDDATFLYLESLKEIPIKRWLSLCDGFGASPTLIAAATYCEGFEWNETVYSLIASGQGGMEPLSHHSIVASFSNRAKLPSQEKPPTLSYLLGLKLDSAVLNYLLSAMNHCPVMDTIEGLETKTALHIAWFLARDGFDDLGYRILKGWVDSKDKGLSFWASFALVLRSPELHDRVEALGSKVENNPVRLFVYSCLREALNQGPFEKQQALEFLGDLSKGSQSVRFTSALRLAAFVPVHVPIVDPYMPYPYQVKMTDIAGKNIEEALNSDKSFIPSAYIEKQHDEEMQNKENVARNLRVGQQIHARKWTEIQVEEALSHGEGLPVTGYINGEALRFIHPETGCSVVIDSETRALLHVGRLDYVYSTPGDASMNAERRLQTTSGSAYPRPVAPDARTVMVMMPLRNEYIDVWRPVQTRQMDGTTYCILPMQSFEPDEDWAFNITSYVFCQNTKFSEGVFMSALRLVTY